MTSFKRSNAFPEWDFRDVVQYINLHRCVATVGGGEQCRNSVGRINESKARRIIEESDEPQQQRSRSLAHCTLCHTHSHYREEAVDYWFRVLQSDASTVAKALSSDCPMFWNSFKRLQAQKAGLIAEKDRLSREVKERSRQEAEEQRLRMRREDADRQMQVLQWKVEEFCHKKDQDRWEKERVEHEESRRQWKKEGLDYGEEQRQREKERAEHEESRRQWKKEGLDYGEEQRQREKERAEHEESRRQWKKEDLDYEEEQRQQREERCSFEEGYRHFVEKRCDHEKRCNQWGKTYHRGRLMRRQWAKERRFHEKRLIQWENKRRHHGEHLRQEHAESRNLEHEPLHTQKMEHFTKRPEETDHGIIKYQASCQHGDEYYHAERQAGVALQSEQDNHVCTDAVQTSEMEETQANDDGDSQASMRNWRRFSQLWDVLDSLSTDFDGWDSNLLRPWPNKASMRLLHSKANTEDSLEDLKRTPFWNKHNFGTSMQRLSLDGCDERGLWKVAYLGQSVKNRIREVTGAENMTE